MIDNTIIGKVSHSVTEPGNSLSSSLVTELIGAKEENSQLKNKIEELEREGKGTRVYVGTEAVSELTFTTDPQTQLNDVLNKVNDNSTQISSIKEQLDNPGIEDKTFNLVQDMKGMTIEELQQQSNIPFSDYLQSEVFEKLTKDSKVILHNIDFKGQPIDLIFTSTQFLEGAPDGLEAKGSILYTKIGLPFNTGDILQFTVVVTVIKGSAETINTQFTVTKIKVVQQTDEVDSSENIEFDASGLTLDDLINELHQIPQYQAEWFNKVNKNTQFIINNVGVDVYGQIYPFQLIFRPVNIATIDNFIGGKDNPRVTLVDYDCYMSMFQVPNKYHLTAGLQLIENEVNSYIDFSIEKVDTNTSVSQEVLEAITTEWEV